MSARPRPVTATFPPPAEYQPRSHSYSLSPGSSTASLVSVLDHDSCASLNNESLDGKHRSQLSQSHQTENSYSQTYETSDSKPQQQQHSNAQQQQQQHNTDSAAVTSTHSKSSRHTARLSCSPTPSRPVSHPGTADNRQLSAWEEWVLQKAIEERDHREREERDQSRREQQVRQTQQKKVDERTKAELKIKEWIQEYDAKVKQQKDLEKQQIKSKQQLDEIKKQETDAKAAVKYQEWLKKVEHDEAERVRLKKEKKEQERREKEVKQQKSEEAFRKWCEQAKSRPRTVPNSYGYSAGKLKGYYDASAYPAPSFVNPVPWRPIEIPQPKPVARKKSPKRRWNPEKYL